MISPVSRLLGLPDEILLCFLDLVDNDALASLRLACKKLKSLVDPIYFAECKISNGQQAIHLVQSVALRLRDPRWLKSLLVSTRFEENGPAHTLHSIPNIISVTTNLRHLRLETPDCNSKAPELRVPWVELQDDYESVFARSTVCTEPSRRFLKNLESFQMHYVDDTKSLYRLTKYSNIFLHPNLRSLTISCACTDLADNLLVPYQGRYYRTTNLEYLHLEECDISPPALKVILSFSRGLKHLIISEGARYESGFGSGTEGARLHGNVLPEELASALTETCDHSLQTLSLDLGWRKLSFVGRHVLDLTGLRVLRHLAVSEATACNMLFEGFNCKHTFHETIPSSVEIFKIFGLNPYNLPPFRKAPRGLGPHQDCFLANKSNHGLPLLREVIWSYRYKNLNCERSPLREFARRFAGEDILMNTIRRLELTRPYLGSLCAAKLLSNPGIDVRMKIEIVEELVIGFIPPYLSYEPSPVTSLLWDSGPPAIFRAQNTEPQPSSSESNDEENQQHSEGSVTSQDDFSNSFPSPATPNAVDQTDEDLGYGQEEEADDATDAEVVFPGLPHNIQIILSRML